MNEKLFKLNPAMNKILKMIKHLKLNLFSYKTIILFSYQEERSSVNNKLRVIKADHDSIINLLHFESEQKYQWIRKQALTGIDLYLTFLGGQCIHRSMVSNHKHAVTFTYKFNYTLPQGASYIHNCETAKQFRGQKAYPSTLSYIAKATKNKLYISTDQTNTASIKGIEKSGFKETNKFRVIILMGQVFIKEYN
ncbi:hypothetical protein PQO03_15060 [Lentisphaera profundi]|uniref:N-acetyltransferase domain-containing protein n=1 Tax=Lentisphaera profundi TaxID=1658616 RepID=A0ABY7VY35_9BACT|nr:hypothetical protein [Lentisphaera profundi]WDE99153.1 hypothetical protein PQO03_15060 [Lentisphaera profundi]